MKRVKNVGTSAKIFMYNSLLIDDHFAAVPGANAPVLTYYGHIGGSDHGGQRTGKRAGGLKGDGVLFETFEIGCGTGKYGMRGVAVKTAAGISIYLGGGERPHIGTTVVSQPRLSLTGDGQTGCTTSVFNLLGHKDDAIAVPIAEALCKSLQQVVVVTAGIHIDAAGPADIALLWEGGRELLRLLQLRLIGSDPSAG